MKGDLSEFLVPPRHNHLPKTAVAGSRVFQKKAHISLIVAFLCIIFTAQHASGLEADQTS